MFNSRYCLQQVSSEYRVIIITQQSLQCPGRDGTRGRTAPVRPRGPARRNTLVPRGPARLIPQCHVARHVVTLQCYVTRHVVTRNTAVLRDPVRHAAVCADGAVVHAGLLQQHVAPHCSARDLTDTDPSKHNNGKHLNSF